MTLHRNVAAQANIPMLMMCGDADTAVSVEGHQFFMLDKNKRSDAELKLYSKGLHSLICEPGLHDEVCRGGSQMDTRPKL